MRYLPLTAKDRAAMLNTIGAASMDDLYRAASDGIGTTSTFNDLPDHQGELAVERHLSRLAAHNTKAGDVPFFIGCGAYKHHIPATVDTVIQRSEFLTTYTPYQPEIAQGTLQTLFEFQTQVARLTAMDVANASMYDGSTSCAEAAIMACRATGRKKVIVSGGVHPHYVAATKLLCEARDIEVIALNPAIDDENALAAHVDNETACLIGQSPNVFGTLTDLSDTAAAAHACGALMVNVFTEAVSFGLVRPPGEMQADIAVGEGQSIGNALNFGGPYIGLFACNRKLMRQMPGRLCGQTVDADGKRGFVLTLASREQHIRRNKAKSNICTNSGLCALAFSTHMTLLGEKGLHHLAMLNHETACTLADTLAGIAGIEVLTPRFFNEFAYRTPLDAETVIARLAEEHGVLGGVAASRLLPMAGMDDVIITAATECNTDSDMTAYAAALKAIL